MIFPAIMMSLLSATSPVAACTTTPPRITTSVVSVSAPALISTDLRLSELADLAKQRGARARHDPLGFYFSQFYYTFQVTAAPGWGECAGSVQIAVQMYLTNRQIEIGRELKSDPCAYSRVLAHYERHAAFDQAIMSQYVHKVRSALHDAIPPVLHHGVRTADVNQGNLDALTQSIIDQALADLTKDREAIGERVDTPEEVSRLQARCIVSIEKGAALNRQRGADHRSGYS